MGFFRLKTVNDNTIIVNRDCGVRVMLDYLKIRLGITEPGVELDLCDEWGNLRFLSQTPPRCSALHLLAARALYTPVEITQTPTLRFKFPMGKPVSIQKLKDAQRKVRRQWGKFQKLRSATSGPLITDEEAVEMIYQVVGSPSADYGKGKSKGRDPAPRSPRQRSSSASKKRRSSLLADISESKENVFEKAKKQPDKAGIALKVKNIPVEYKQIDTESTKVGKKISASGKLFKSVESKERHEAKQDDGVASVMPKRSTDKKEDEKYEESVPNAQTDKYNKPHDTQVNTETSKMASEKDRPPEADQSSKYVDEAKKNPELTMSAESKGEGVVPVERSANEATDSGIESAPSRLGRQARDGGMPDTSSDAQSASAEAGSNEESAIESASVRSKARLKQRRSSTKMSAIPEQDALSNMRMGLAATEANSKTADIDQQPQSDYASGSVPSDASNVGDERRLNEGASGGTPATATESLAATTSSQDMPKDSSLLCAPAPPSSPPSVEDADIMPDDMIAGVTVSIMPPNLAAPHRRSIDVTALLGLPMTDRTAAAEAGASTGRGVPSLIDEEWRQTGYPADHLLGVLSATSKLVYLGSALSSPVDAPQINIISATEEEARRLSTAGSAALVAAGSGEGMAGTEEASEDRGDDVTSQADTRMSPSGSVVET